MSKCIRLIGFLICSTLSLKASEPVELAVPAQMAAEVGMVVDAHGCLDLSGRNLTELPRILDIQDCNKIKTINLSNNELTNESLNAAWFPATVTYVDLSKNKLTDFPATFISHLSKKVKTIDLRGNQIVNIGEDVDIAQTGLKIFIEKKNLSDANLATIRARLERTGAGLTFGQRCIERLTSPCGRMTKLLGGALLLAGSELIRKASDINPQSPVSRAVKIVQNGLFFAGALHTLYNTYYTQHKVVEDNPEVVAGVAGLFIGTTPGLISDTRALACGSAAPVGKIESAYSNAVYSGMRELGAMYACGECISWLKARWARSLRASIARQNNALIAYN